MFTSALLQPHRSDDVNVADGHDEGRKDESHDRISEHYKLKTEKKRVTSRKHIFFHHWLAAWVINLIFLIITFWCVNRVQVFGKSYVKNRGFCVAETTLCTSIVRYINLT